MFYLFIYFKSGDLLPSLCHKQSAEKVMYVFRAIGDINIFWPVFKHVNNLTESEKVQLKWNEYVNGSMQEGHSVLFFHFCSRFVSF